MPHHVSIASYHVVCKERLHVERHAEVVSGERSHDFTIIALHNATEDRNGSRDGLLAEEPIYRND